MILALLEEFKFFKLNYFCRIQSKLTTLKRQVVSPCGRTTTAHDSQLQALSVGQLMVLRRLAVLKLTASMEKFNNKSSNSW